MGKGLGAAGFVGWAICVLGCEFPRPAAVGDDDGGMAVCRADQLLRCDGKNLVRCNGEGTAEVSEPCLLGCNAAELRCNDIAPSNSLAQYLDLTASEPDWDVGTSAVINTDDGTVMVDGSAVLINSATLAQPSAPEIRIFIVRSFTANDVTVTGSNALAVVSNGDITIGRVLAASASYNRPGAGGFNDGTCKGGDQAAVTRGLGGTGGGGFGSDGGEGGSSTNGNGTASGGAGGTTTGNPRLIPLRGGCDSGTADASLFGAGGGAIQLVSRTRIVISGVVAANGSSWAGGGSGGGILLEAPIVEVSGSVVANGGAGSGGCLLPVKGEDGRLDATPATAGLGCDESGVDGGVGGSRNSGAGPGASINLAGDTFAFAGHGGGGVGRIRVNTAPGGFRSTGLFSPNPSTGTIATR